MYNKLRNENVFINLKIQIQRSVWWSIRLVQHMKCRENINSLSSQLVTATQWNDVTNEKNKQAETSLINHTNKSTKK